MDSKNVLVVRLRNNDANGKRRVQKQKKNTSKVRARESAASNPNPSNRLVSNFSTLSYKPSVSFFSSEAVSVSFERFARSTCGGAGRYARSNEGRFLREDNFEGSSAVSSSKSWKERRRLGRLIWHMLARDFEEIVMGILTARLVRSRVSSSDVGMGRGMMLRDSRCAR